MYRVKAKLIRVAVFAKRAETAKPGNAGQLPARPRQCMGIMILPPSHRFTQWGRLGEILGGVRFPWSSLARCRLMLSLPGGVVDKFGTTYYSIAKLRFTIESSRSSRFLWSLGRREGSLCSPEGVFSAAKLPQKRISIHYYYLWKKVYMLAFFE